MSKLLSKLFGNAGGSVLDKLAGVADRFIRTKDEKAEFEKQMTQIFIDAEAAMQKNVTERWKADMGGDVKLAKLIRPLTLITLMFMFMVTMVADSIDGWPFTVKDSYVDLLQILMMTAFGAYFAGRTIEKVKR